MNVPVCHFNTSSIVAMVARNAVAMQRAIASFITRIATALLRIFSNSGGGGGGFKWDLRHSTIHHAGIRFYNQGNNVCWAAPIVSTANPYIVSLAPIGAHMPMGLACRSYPLWSHPLLRHLP